MPQFSPQPALNALRKLRAPASTYPGYDATTSTDPNYGEWSAQRPAGIESPIGGDLGFESSSQHLPVDKISSFLSGANEANRSQIYKGVDMNNVNALREAQRNDLETRMANQGPNPILSAKLDLVSRDIKADPNSWDAVQAREAEKIHQTAEANLQGFTTPQAKAAYDRQMAEEKMRVPITQARETGAGNILERRVANQGALELEEQRQKGDVYARALADALKVRTPSTEGASEGGQDISSISRSGMTFRAPTRGVPPPLLNALKTARAQAAAGAVGSSEALQSAIGSVLGYDDASPELKTKALELARDPRSAGMDIGTLISKLRGPGGQPLNPQEAEDVRRLLGYIRGDF